MTNEEIIECVLRAVIYFVMIWIVSDFHYDYRKRRERKESQDYCSECDHIEMCSWYPRDGCEWLKTDRYNAGYNDAKREIALSGEYERAYQRGFEDGRKSEWSICKLKEADDLAGTNDNICFLAKGTPLPKGHGRLIDADDANNNIVGYVDSRDCPTS